MRRFLEYKTRKRAEAGHEQLRLMGLKPYPVEQRGKEFRVEYEGE